MASPVCVIESAVVESAVVESFCVAVCVTQRIVFVAFAVVPVADVHHHVFETHDTAAAGSAFFGITGWGQAQCKDPFVVQKMNDDRFDVAALFFVELFHCGRDYGYRTLNEYAAEALACSACIFSIHCA